MTTAPRSRGIDIAATSRGVVATGLGAGMVAIELSVRGETDLRTQIVAQMLAFALFLPAAWLCWRGLRVGRAGLGLVLVVAVALHAAALDPRSPPPLTTDTYRYAWDARIQAGGINPYRYVPNARALERLRDDGIWKNVNRRDWATVYPPGAEASFLAARVAFGNDVRASTWLMLVAEAARGRLARARARPHRRPARARRGARLASTRRERDRGERAFRRACGPRVLCAARRLGLGEAWSRRGRGRGRRPRQARAAPSPAGAAPWRRAPIPRRWARLDCDRVSRVLVGGDESGRQPVPLPRSRGPRVPRLVGLAAVARP